MDLKCIPFSKGEQNLRIFQQVDHGELESRFQCPLPRHIFRYLKYNSYSIKFIFNQGNVPAVENTTCGLKCNMSMHLDSTLLGQCSIFTLLASWTSSFSSSTSLKECEQERVTTYARLETFINSWRLKNCILEIKSTLDTYEQIQVLFRANNFS